MSQILVIWSTVLGQDVITVTADLAGKMTTRFNKWHNKRKQSDKLLAALALSAVAGVRIHT